jgi:hypothetical protein
VERRSFQLAPSDEIDLAGIKLVAERRRSIELHELLRRWLGWSLDRLQKVDRAFREVCEAAHLRIALVLRGDGSLTGIAHRLHRATLGGRPFVALGPDERGMEGLERAITGTLCLDASKLPSDLRFVILNLRTPDTCVRLVACANSMGSIDGLAARFRASLRSGSLRWRRVPARSIVCSRLTPSMRRKNSAQVIPDSGHGTSKGPRQRHLDLRG